MPEETKTELNAQSVEDFLATARRRFASAAEEEKGLREKFESDLRFASPDGDEQWDPIIKMQREAAGRPAMAFPRCHTFVQQVANEARQKKPSIKFTPRLDGDKDTAEIYEGLARYIQYSSDAQVAYETAIEYSAGASFGYYRFLTNYIDNDDDDVLELAVVPVLDPLQIYGALIPACFNRKCKYAFVVEDMAKDEFKQQYPDSEVVSLGWSEAAKRADGWLAEDTIRIAEYWYIEEKRIEGKRRPKSIVKFCKTNGIEILPDTETEWPGSCIPIIPVLGKQLIIGGKPHLYSVVRPQKSAQQLINYSKTRIAETLSIAPVSPFIAVEGQLENHEKEWQNMNKVLTPVLTYKSVDVDGRAAPAPQRQTFEPPIQALAVFVGQEIDDMKATTGLFDPSMGSQTGQSSGKAIQSLQMQGSQSTMHFLDNLGRAFKKGGEIIAELIPIIYDTEREIQILGEDEQPKIVKINGEHQDENGQIHNYDMKAAKFVPIITMARAYDSKRMETFDMLQQLVQSAPTLLPTFGDVLFRNSDMAGADIVAERFKKMLPANLQDDKDQQQIPPQVQAQMQQLKQSHDALNQACQEYEKQIQQLTFEKQAKIVETQGKMSLLDKELTVKMAVAEIETKAQDESERKAFIQEVVKQTMAQAHEVAMQTVSQNQQQAIAQQQQAQPEAGGQSQTPAEPQDQGQQQPAEV
jgi:hypothetical protein